MQRENLHLPLGACGAFDSRTPGLQESEKKDTLGTSSLILQMRNQRIPERGTSLVQVTHLLFLMESSLEPAPSSQFCLLPQYPPPVLSCAVLWEIGLPSSLRIAPWFMFLELEYVTVTAIVYGALSSSGPQPPDETATIISSTLLMRKNLGSERKVAIPRSHSWYRTWA